MKRAIITPAVLASEALAELKDWLAITGTRDDDLLQALLLAGLELFEDYTGLMPLAQLCEEVLPATGGWSALRTAPVQAVTEVLAIAPGGARTPLSSTAYESDLCADGSARVRVLDNLGQSLAAVRFTAGLEEDWEALATTVRHGVLRYAAFQHREREQDVRGHAALPSAIAALWRPWRRMHLA